MFRFEFFSPSRALCYVTSTLGKAQHKNPTKAQHNTAHHNTVSRVCAQNKTPLGGTPERSRPRGLGLGLGSPAPCSGSARVVRVDILLPPLAAMANSVVRRLFPPRLGGLGLVGATPSGVAVRLLTSTGWLGWCGPQHSSACSVAQFSFIRAHTRGGGKGKQTSHPSAPPSCETRSRRVRDSGGGTEVLLRRQRNVTTTTKKKKKKKGGSRRTTTTQSVQTTK